MFLTNILAPSALAYQGNLGLSTTSVNEGNFLDKEKFKDAYAKFIKKCSENKNVAKEKKQLEKDLSDTGKGLGIDGGIISFFVSLFQK